MDAIQVPEILCIFVAVRIDHFRAREERLFDEQNSHSIIVRNMIGI